METERDDVDEGGGGCYVHQLRRMGSIKAVFMAFVTKGDGYPITSIAVAFACDQANWQKLDKLSSLFSHNFFKTNIKYSERFVIALRISSQFDPHFRAEFSLNKRKYKRAQLALGIGDEDLAREALKRRERNFRDWEAEIHRILQLIS
ncbi:hypothetical protein L2E82_45485 [Cichorium intybus]|uniref:Uncharacterized protein n=1 Tax=Cichorium intybus TaxID=13427 RepID=A0ACB8ZTN4_CICIN|nr:hypothetical protein L2E82_45485 [Cichorium intybus]